MSKETPVIDLSLHRLRLQGTQGQGNNNDDNADLDLDGSPLAYIEAVWGHSVYGYNAYTVDMEAYRREGSANLPLREAETDYEKELLIQHIRALANDLARQFNRADLLRDEDEL
jgi:hypothetical protein